MKKLFLDGIVFIGRALALALSLVLSATSYAAPAASNQPGSTGGEFNHMTTGFALSGGHAVAACESCHVGGVFKGTPKNCDGCHALGKRVVATPKSSSHIVTDAPCESCHFNTSTFLGARFNHGSAQPGKCQTCHNGRQSQGKPASHGSGNKATASCDSCHRTFAWHPNTWNHVGVAPGTCKTCHENPSQVASENLKPSGHTTVAKSTYQCDECHSFGGWFPGKFKHNTSTSCATCHASGNIVLLENLKPGSHNTPIQYTIPSKDDIKFNCDDCHSFKGWYPAAFKHNVPQACDTCHTKKTGHIAIALNADCGSCHRTRNNGWLPASVHTGNESGICRTCHANTPGQPQPSHSTNEYTSLSCDVCHKSQTTWAGASGHIDLVPPHVPTCRSCHSGKSHDGKDGASSSMDCSRSGCHRPGGSKGRLFSKWD